MKLIHGIGRLSVVTAAVAFLLLLSSLFAGFVSRELFSHGLIWSDELARLSFVWCALFGATAAWSTDALHRIDLLTRDLRGLPALLATAVANTLVGATLIYLIYYGWRMMSRALDQTTSTLEISGAWFYAPLPVAASLMLVITACRWLKPPAAVGQGQMSQGQLSHK